MFLDRYLIMRNLILLLSLSLLPCLLLACATSPTLHKTYDYLTITCPLNVHHQPGSQFSTLAKQDTQTLSIRWQPHPGPDTSATTPSRVILQAELIGPFPSLKSFYQSPQPDGSISYLPTTPVVAVAPAIHTTSWTNHIYTSRLQFPHRLVSGYYQVVETIDMSDSTHAAGRCIIKV